jgi:hypothetical protein
MLILLNIAVFLLGCSIILFYVITPVKIQGKIIDIQKNSPTGSATVIVQYNYSSFLNSQYGGITSSQTVSDITPGLNLVIGQPQDIYVNRVEPRSFNLYKETINYGTPAGFMFFSILIFIICLVIYLTTN